MLEVNRHSRYFFNSTPFEIPIVHRVVCKELDGSMSKISLSCTLCE